MEGVDDDVEEEYILLELDQFQSFLQSLAMDNKSVVLDGLEEKDLRSVSLAVSGSVFHGEVEPLVGTALVFASGSLAPICVSRKVVLKQTLQPFPKKAKKSHDDDDDDD
jgi:hypothetical protein